MQVEVDPMFPSQNLSGMPLDPNTQRAIEELALVINDVEQRLQLIRMGIAQAVPAWPSFGAGHPTFPQTPSLFTPGGFGIAGLSGIGGVPNLQAILSNPVLLQQLLAANVAKLHAGVPPTAYGGVPSFGGVSPFGSPVGVNAPFGFQSPFQAPFTPFRF
jgi:hypothetical protein